MAMYAMIDSHGTPVAYVIAVLFDGGRCRLYEAGAHGAGKYAW